MTSPVRAGDVIAQRYELRELVARGPAGAWFRAFDRDVEAEVALLLVRAELVTSEAACERFLHAAEAVRSLGHKHLLQLFAQGRAHDTVYVTAQPGQPLGLSPRLDALVAQVQAIAEGLDALHRQGHVHGRLVPGDIVEVSGLLKVAGAGIFQAIHVELAIKAWNKLARFWAPEVLQGQSATPASDVFSLAAITAEALAGTDAGHPKAAMVFVAAQSRALYEALEPALASDPRARPVSPLVLVDRLRAVLHDAMDEAPTAFFVKPSALMGERTVLDSVPPEVLAYQAAQRSPQEGRAEHSLWHSLGPPVTLDEPVPGEPQEKALPFVSMKPPSEQGAKQRTPVIPAIDKPGMKPKIRPITSPAVPVVPSNLGNYAPPVQRARDRRRVLMWISVTAAAVVSASVAAGLTLAFHDSDESTDSARTGAEGASRSPEIRDAPGKEQDPALATVPRCTAPLVLATLGDHAYCIDAHESPGKGQLPEVMVTWTRAEELCRGRGLRLCTADEWENACRGPKGASWPYGASFAPDACNTGAKGRKLVASGSLESCKSAAGAYDMSGNAAEWTADRTIRGGSAMDRSQGACSRSEPRKGPDRAYRDVGFRCCADATITRP